MKIFTSIFRQKHILFIFLGSWLISQNSFCTDRPDSLEILFSPEQLREDANDFFDYIFSRHRDAYHFCGIDGFERKKRRF